MLAISIAMAMAMVPMAGLWRGFRVWEKLPRQVHVSSLVCYAWTDQTEQSQQKEG